MKDQLYSICINKYHVSMNDLNNFCSKSQAVLLYNQLSYLKLQVGGILYKEALKVGHVHLSIKINNSTFENPQFGRYICMCVEQSLKLYRTSVVSGYNYVLFTTDNKGLRRILAFTMKAFINLAVVQEGNTSLL